MPFFRVSTEIGCSWFFLESVRMRLTFSAGYPLCGARNGEDIVHLRKNAQRCSWCISVALYSVCVISLQPCAQAFAHDSCPTSERTTVGNESCSFNWRGVSGHCTRIASQVKSRSLSMLSSARVCYAVATVTLFTD